MHAGSLVMSFLDRARWILVVVLGTASGWPRTASATEEGEHPRASSGTPEVSIGGGWVLLPLRYAGAPLRGSVAQGGSVDLGVGLRTSARWSALATAEYAEVTAGSGPTAALVKAGLGARCHLLPRASADPWVGAGTSLHFVSAGPVFASGFEVVRLSVGVDVRASALLSVGPVASLGLDVFPRISGRDPLDAPARWYASGLVGLAGRFDLSAMGLDD